MDGGQREGREPTPTSLHPFERAGHWEREGSFSSSCTGRLLEVGVSYVPIHLDSVGSVCSQKQPIPDVTGRGEETNLAELAVAHHYLLGCSQAGREFE